METKGSLKNKPRLGHMPGLERLDMSTEDFEHEERPALVVWAVVFFAVAAACLVLTRALTVGQQATVLFVLLFILFVGLGSITLLSRFVRTGP